MLKNFDARKITKEESPEAKMDLPQQSDNVKIDPTIIEKDMSTTNALEHLNNRQKKYFLVLDLDETLVHTSFKKIASPDLVAKCEIGSICRELFIKKRPGVDDFLQRMAQSCELIVFTRSYEEYANAVLDLLDTKRLFTKRLFRQDCNDYVKDLSKFGWNLSHTLLVDNNPKSYSLHPNNAVPILSWYDDPYDTELTDIAPFLEKLTQVDNIRTVLDASKPWRVTYKKLKKITDQPIEIKNQLASSKPEDQKDKKSMIPWLLTTFSSNATKIKQEVLDNSVVKNSPGL